MIIRNYLAAFFILGTSLISHGYDEIIKSQIEQYKKDYDAIEASEGLRNIIDPIVKFCEIKKKIIFLESKTHISHAVSSPFTSKQKFIIIQTHDPKFGGKPRTIDAIEFDICHEIGHFVNGDHNFIHHPTVRAHLMRFLALGAGFATYTLLGKINPNLSRITKMLPTALAGWVSGVGLFFALKYRDSLSEEAADRFAYEKLLSQNKIGPALSEIVSNLFWHECYLEKLGYEYPERIISGYPSCLTRARLGIMEMEKKGYKITQDAEFLASDPKFKEYLLGFIQKYCPDLLDKKPTQN